MLKEIKPAIFEKLNRMYEWSFHNSEFDLSNKPLNTRIELMGFRKSILSLNQFLLDGDEKGFLSLLENLRKFVYKVGCDAGHIYGNTSTGSWGVRYSDCMELKTMINYQLPEGIQMPQYNKPGYSFLFPVNDGHDTITVDLVSVKFNEYFVSFKLQPHSFSNIYDDYYNLSGWEDSLSFSTITYRPEDNKPLFMKIYKKA